MPKIKSIIVLMVVLCIIFSFTACDSGKKDESTSEASVASTTVKAAGTTAPEEIKKLELAAFTSWAVRSGVEAIINYANSKSAETGAILEVTKMGDSDQGQQVLATRLVSGDLPDIFYCFNLSELQRYVPKFEETLAPLIDGEWKKLYDESLLNSYYYSDKGVLYAAPLGDAAVYGIYYNKKIFNELGVQVPKTFDELLDICKKADAKGIIPYAVAGKDGWPISIAIPGGLTRNKITEGMDPKEFIDQLDSGKIRYKDLEAFRLMFEQTKQLGPYFGKTWLTNTYAQCQQLFMEGKAAMFPMANFCDGDLAKINPEVFNNDIGYMAFPVGDGETHVSLLPPQPALTIPLKAKNPELAQKMVQFLESVEAQNEYYKAQKSLPFANGVQSDLSPVAQDQLAIMQSQVNKFPFTGGTAKNTPLDVWNNVQTQVAIGKMTVDEAIAELDKAVEATAKAKKDPNWIGSN